MSDIKYIYETKYGKFELVENFKFDEKKEYPLFKSKTLKEFDDLDEKVILLNYPIPTLKSRSKHIIDHLKEEWDNGYSDFLSDIEGAKNYSNLYKYNNEYYLVLRNSNFFVQEQCNLAIFDRELLKYEELGDMQLNDKICEEILELDQNLQSCASIDLMLELMEENTDMNKYIEFIKKNIKEEDLDKCFFFDEYIYELFSTKYLEVLNDVAPYKNDGYGIKGVERFIAKALKGEYHDECKCCNV